MLDEALEVFKQLCDHTFAVEFQVKGKNETKRIEINFEKKQFYHLAGLHYLTDIKGLLRGSPQNVFNKLIKDEKLRNIVTRSLHYCEIESRIENIANFQNTLNRMTEIYKYRRPEWSNIDADYVIRSRSDGKTSYYFLVCDITGYYVGNSTINDPRTFVHGKYVHDTIYKRFIPKRNKI